MTKINTIYTVNRNYKEQEELNLITSRDFDKEISINLCVRTISRQLF